MRTEPSLNLSLMHGFFCIFAIFFLTCGITDASWAQDFGFETDFFRYVLDCEGNSRSISDKNSNQQWLAATALPFTAITKAGISHAISSLKQNGELFEAKFGNSGVQANYRIITRPHYLVIELVSLQGQGVEEVRLMQLKPVSLQNAGGIVACRSNDKFAICVLALSERVNSRLEQDNVISSSVVPEFGMQGEKVALIAVPTIRFMQVVQEVERDYGLPSPKIGGYWAKESPDVRSSYLFTDLTEANAEETIRFAKLGGFKYVLIYCSTWASSAGSYPINRKNFPRGEESLKATIDKCHVAGLKVGMHMMTSLIDKNDPLVHPNPDSRLLRDAATTLNLDLSFDADEITATSELTPLPDGQPLNHDGIGSADIQIENEIIQCKEVGKSKLATFSGCVRGYNDTQVVSHKAGSKIYRLVVRHGSYLADLKTSLKDEIAERVAGLINRCGFDMIYFDGGEVNDANGSWWYWGGQQQMSVLKRVRRELLVQGSGITHWTWHLFSRITCDDYAAIWTTHWLDFHKVKRLQSLEKEFMPAELGWWGLFDNAFDHPATLPDEVEQCGIRMLAFDVPVSIETTFKSLKTNGRSGEILEKLGRLEEMRIHDRISLETRQTLGKGNWNMVDSGGQTQFHPIDRQMQRLTLPSEINIHNPGKAQALKFRLYALPSLEIMGDSANIVLFGPDHPLELKLPQSTMNRAGALAAEIDLIGSSKQKSAASQSAQPLEIRTPWRHAPLDLHRHRGLAISLKVEGVQTDTARSAPVLNVQLQDAGTMYRDYYVNLDFIGERTIIIPETSAERLLTEFVPIDYNAKMAMYNFNYSKIVSLNFRWMRLPLDQSFSCNVGKVEALAEIDSTLHGLEVGVGDRVLSIPMPLSTGSYIEVGSDNLLRVFDQNGNLGPTVKNNPKELPVLQPGENKIVLKSSVPGQVRILITTLSSKGN